MRPETSSGASATSPSTWGWRVATPAQPMHVDLDGAVEFRLQVEETADGIACDQADWVEAPDAQREWTGQELLEHGLPLAITDHPGAAVFTYRRVGDPR